MGGGHARAAGPEGGFAPQAGPAEKGKRAAVGAPTSAISPRHRICQPDSPMPRAASSTCGSTSRSPVYALASNGGIANTVSARMIAGSPNPTAGGESRGSSAGGGGGGAAVHTRNTTPPPPPRGPRQQ